MNPKLRIKLVFKGFIINVVKNKIIPKPAGAAAAVAAPVADAAAAAAPVAQNATH